MTEVDDSISTTQLCCVEKVQHAMHLWSMQKDTLSSRVPRVGQCVPLTLTWICRTTERSSKH